MASMTRRLFSALLAAGLVAGLSGEPAFAQITPGGALNGPAGGTASTTAPSNSEGTPAGGTGNLGTTRVGPSSTTRATTAPARHRARHARRRAHRAARPVTSGTGSDAGLNGSNAPAR